MSNKKPPLPRWEGRKGRGIKSLHPHLHPPPSRGRREAPRFSFLKRGLLWKEIFLR
jgi:hypothetical protein